MIVGAVVVLVIGLSKTITRGLKKRQPETASILDRGEQLAVTNKRRRQPLFVQILVFYLMFSLAVGVFEVVNIEIDGTPWFIYENALGELYVIGQEYPDAPVMRGTNDLGETVYVLSEPLPVWIRIVEALFFPVLFVIRLFARVT